MLNLLQAWEQAECGLVRRASSVAAAAVSVLAGMLCPVGSLTEKGRNCN